MDLYPRSETTSSIPSPSSTHISNFYEYNPSVAVAVVAVILFFIITLASFVLFFWKRSWVFWVMIIGMVAECLGLAARVVSAKNTDEMMSFLLQYFLPVLAPSFIAAACYMIFGRLVWLVTPQDRLSFRALFIPPRWITPIFVSFDIFSFMVQATGIQQLNAYYQAGSNGDHDKLEAGYNILKIGLALQLVCFLLFAVVGARFILISKTWTPAANEGNPTSHWRKLGWAVNGSAFLITIRAVYRILEFASEDSGPSHYIAHHEWTFWIFDIALMFVATGIFVVFHPGFYLPAGFKGFRLNKNQLRRTRESKPLGMMNRRKDVEQGDDHSSESLPLHSTPAPVAGFAYHGYGMDASRPTSPAPPEYETSRARSDGYSGVPVRERSVSPAPNALGPPQPYDAGRMAAGL